MTDVVEYVREHDDELADYGYLQQFAPDADGLQINTEIPYSRMKEVYGGDMVWGGIAGERQMRSYLDTGLLDGNVTREHFKRGFTTEEFNDLINYYAWNTYDLLALRATEGESEIIPRQEYEFLSTTYAIQRWPEFLKLIVDKVGLEGLMDVARKGREELGAADYNSIGWSIFVPSGFGCIGLEDLGLVDADDPVHVDKKKTAYTTAAALCYASRDEDGYLLPSQNRYVAQAKSDDVVEFITDHLSEFEPGDRAQLRQTMAAAELFSFLLHYDNRVGQADHGPYFVEDGKPMVVREIGLSRPYLPWNDIAENRDLPFSLVVAMVIEPDDLGLQEIRVPLTAFTHPSDYMESVEQAAVFIRREPEGVDPLPLSELERPSMDDLLDLSERANDAVTEWYERATRLSRREKIMNGAMTYYAGMIVPLLRATGTFELARDELDLFELPPMTSEFYYRMHGGVAKEQMPNQIMFGHGWSEIPEETAAESGYADYLAEAREMNWTSDLSGLSPVPEPWAGKTDEHNLLDVGLPYEGEMSPRELADFVANR